MVEFIGKNKCGDECKCEDEPKEEFNVEVSGEDFRNLSSEQKREIAEGILDVMRKHYGKSNNKE